MVTSTGVCNDLSDSGVEGRFPRENETAMRCGGFNGVALTRFLSVDAMRGGVGVTRGGGEPPNRFFLRKVRPWSSASGCSRPPDFPAEYSRSEACEPSRCSCSGIMDTVLSEATLADSRTRNALDDRRRVIALAALIMLVVVDVELTVELVVMDGFVFVGMADVGSVGDLSCARENKDLDRYRKRRVVSEREERDDEEPAPGVVDTRTGICFTVTREGVG